MSPMTMVYITLPHRSSRSPQGVLRLLKDSLGLLRTPPPLLHHSFTTPQKSLFSPQILPGLLKDSSRSLSITDQRLFRESSRSPQGVFRESSRSPQGVFRESSRTF
jgi:hypothetical protein